MPQLQTNLSESKGQRTVDEVLEEAEREGYLERVKLDLAEALIPDNLHDYRDPYDSRWRGDKPYIGLGNAVRNEITEDFSTSVRWLRPGDLVDSGGVYRWTEKHFPGYDPYMDDGVHDVTGRAIRGLVKHGFLHKDSEVIFTRTSKPPHTAYSVFGNEEVKYRLKRLAEDREMLRQSFSGEIVAEVVNTAYDEGPTREQYERLEKLTGVHSAPGVPDQLSLTDADFMNPTAEMIAHVAAIKEHYRVVGEKTAKERAETERFHARIERFKQTATPEHKQAVKERARQLESQRDRRSGEPFVRYLLQAMDELENESRPWD
jgi:hypothetical protein